MSVIADLVRAGVDPDLIARVAEEIAAARALGARDAAPARTARQDRNSRYYEARKERLEASERVLNKTDKTLSDETPSPLPEKEKSSPTPPSKEKQTLTHPRMKSARATRLDPHWAPDVEGFSFASAALGGDRTVIAEAAKFRDYWIARPGAGGCKLDWDATWRNWVRSASERLPRARAGPGAAPPISNTYLRALTELNLDEPSHHDQPQYDFDLSAEPTSP